MGLGEKGRLWWRLSESSPRVNTGSVVLKEREQVITAVCGEVRWTQVREQFVRIGEFRKKLRTEQTH